MTQWLDKLNLQPHERRWLMVGFLIMTVVLNYWLVWPYFGEWKDVALEIEKLERNQSTFATEIGKKASYETQIKSLQQAGGEVLQEEQANRLQTTIQSKAAEFGVTVGNIRPIATAARGTLTNAFFDEQQMSVEVFSGEPELINFLHALGTGDSLIRVRDIARLRPDQTQTKLQTTLTVVASFQKKAKPSPQPAASKTPAPGAIQPKGTAATNAVSIPKKK